MGIKEEDYITDIKQNKATKKLLYEKLTAYREWLLQITICDPACGSGAFLVQALDFLINEHHYIDELQAKLFGDTLVLSDVEKSILENNLFGVDINEESVEIAKLSLWLRTAQPNRKLNDLSNNIKCGNSLIDDPLVGGEKSFEWKMEFPQVFPKMQKKAWHITTATHNSRYSQRMFDNHVKLGEPVWLTPEDERHITRTVAEIVETDDLNILAYNICGDHMHIALVCEEKQVSTIVGKIKSMSARAANIAAGRTTRGHAPSADASSAEAETAGHAPLTRGETQTPIWTQKFGCKEITSDEQLYNTINYIVRNREKHGLPPFNNGACPVVDSFPVVDSYPVVDIYPRTVSPEYAFRTEYKNGFDVIIGNPPYVRLETMKELSESMSGLGYKTFEKRGDLYCLFVEKGFNLLKNNGLISFIMPNKWLQAGYGKPLREYFLNYELIQLIDFGDIQIFEGVTTYPCIFVSRKALPKEEFTVSVLEATNQDDFYSNVSTTAETFQVNQFSGDTWVISSGNEKRLIERLQQKFKNLSEFVGGGAFYGMKTGLTDAFLIDESIRNNLIRVC